MKTIERLRELLGKATPGKWFSKSWCVGVLNPSRVLMWSGNNKCSRTPENAANVELVAAMQNALPALLSLVEAQAAEIENAREFRNRLVEYTLSYLDAKGERTLDMERRLIAGYAKLKDATDAARRALEGGE